MANFQKIKVLCEQRGINLSDLAEQIGVTPTGLGLIIKSGKTMTDKLERIAQVLDVRVGVFFDEEERAEAEQAYGLSDFRLIIEQKDKIIEQKDEIIRILVNQK